MATTQNGTAERGTPIPQKGGSGRPAKLTKADEQERLAALKIIPQASTVAKLQSMRFTDPNNPKRTSLTFHQLVEVHSMASDAEKAAKQVKNDAGKDLCAALAGAGLEAVMDGDRKVTIVVGESASRLDAKALLELGVDASLIARATVMGNEYTYALNTPPKEKKEK